MVRLTVTRVLLFYSSAQYTQRSLDHLRGEGPCEQRSMSTVSRFVPFPEQLSKHGWIRRWVKDNVLAGSWNPGCPSKLKRIENEGVLHNRCFNPCRSSRSWDGGSGHEPQSQLIKFEESGDFRRSDLHAC